MGRGARGAELLWRAGRPPSEDVVIFLHGWEPLPPYFYGAWLRHLVMTGNTVIYPAYQGKDTSTEQMPRAALAGIASGLRIIRADRGSVVAIGLTTGGVIAFDYAARADGEGLPVPLGVVAVYPGQNPPGGRIPLADLGQIPAATILMAVSGPGNRLPNGDREARVLLERAERVPARHRSYYVAPRSVTATGLVGGNNEITRRTLWRRVDQLIRGVRLNRNTAA